MQLDKIIEGKHNKEHFRYENGFLNMFNKKWDKDDIKTLVEAANLLELEGYPLKSPTGMAKTQVESLFGFKHEIDVKTYDEETGG